MGKLVRQHYMENTHGNHNKKYRVVMEENGAYFDVYGEYGPIGGWTKKDIKDTGVNRFKADCTFDALVKDKLNGGYETVSMTAPTPTPTPKFNTAKVNLGTMPKNDSDPDDEPVKKSPPPPQPVKWPATPAKSVPLPSPQPKKPNPKIVPLDDRFREI